MIFFRHTLTGTFGNFRVSRSVVVAGQWAAVEEHGPVTVIHLRFCTSVLDVTLTVSGLRSVLLERIGHVGR